MKTDFRPRDGQGQSSCSRALTFRPGGLAALKDDVQQHGLYHAYRLAIAPTQSISYVQNATSSVMPIVEPIETRTYANSTTYYPMPYLSKDNFFYYKSAYQWISSKCSTYRRNSTACRSRDLDRSACQQRRHRPENWPGTIFTPPRKA